MKDGCFCVGVLCLFPVQLPVHSDVFPQMGNFLLAPSSMILWGTCSSIPIKNDR